MRCNVSFFFLLLLLFDDHSAYKTINLVKDRNHEKKTNGLKRRNKRMVAGWEIEKKQKEKSR